MRTDDHGPLSVIVSYSHIESGWTPQQSEERRQFVYRFVYALRSVGGIVADADIFHPNEDWTRWGPHQVDTSDFVLVIASPSWRDAWIGAGDMAKSKGVRAEADAVRSIEAQGRDVLQKRVRLIMLPGSTDADVPTGMHGIGRYRIHGFDLADLEPLLRDLTDQPMFVKPPVGDVPVFPPGMTTHTSDVAKLETTSSSGAPAPVGNSAEKQERIRQFQEQLDALPQPLPGESPDVPWLLTRHRVEQSLSAELAEDTNTKQVTPTRPADVRWFPVGNVDLQWTDTRDRTMSYQEPALVLHLLPVPQTPVSQRVLSFLDSTLSDLMFKAGHLHLGQAFEPKFPGDDVVVELDHPGRSYNDVDLGRFLGCRVARSGQVSVWFSLARDSMGAVLDQQRITAQLRDGIEFGAQILQTTHGDPLGRVAVAAELVNTTMLTNGTLDQLGRRSQTSLPGATRNDVPHMRPDEAVAPTALRPPLSGIVAAEVARIVVRDWRG